MTAPAKPITLKEIARRADTSTMAVSVVLNGARSNTRVSDTTRRRIEAIAADLNYTPNAMARSLKSQRTHTLGVLFNWAGTHAIHNLYSVAILDGIVAAAADEGYHILIYTVAWKSAATSSAAFSDRRTDGVVIVAPDEQSDVVSGLVGLGLKAAVISSATAVPGVPFVTIDNRRGVALVLEHLYAQGHTRIAYGGFRQTRHNLRERYETFCQWMTTHGLEVPPDYVLTDLQPGNRDRNVAELTALMRLPQPPTAIFAGNDDLAADVLDMARGLGISVPEQLSVVGFDDTLIASLTVPKLTTVRQPLFEMGRQAAHLLIATIAQRGDTERPAHVIAPELIIRASTAPAGAA